MGTAVAVYGPVGLADDVVRAVGAVDGGGWGVVFEELSWGCCFFFFFEWVGADYFCFVCRTFER